MQVVIHRIYNTSSIQDCTRILVDRLWPRGIRREDARLDEWWKDIAPSGDLRKWFAHEVEKWPQFRERYLVELEEKREMVLELLQGVKNSPCLHLLFAAKDEEHNQAVVLKEFLEKL